MAKLRVSPDRPTVPLLTPHLKAGRRDATTLSRHSPIRTSYVRPAILKPPATSSPVAHHRLYATNDKSKEEEGHSRNDPKWIRQMRYSLVNHPSTTMGTLVVADIGNVMLNYGIITALGVSFSSEFALAYMISRSLRRPRAVIDIAAATLLGRAYPPLQSVRLSLALKNQKPLDLPESVKENALYKWATDKDSSVRKFGDTVDRLGIAYTMGSRAVGTVSVLTIYSVLKAGVDITPLLKTVGVEKVGDTLGTMAAAAVLASPLFPLVVAATGYIAPHVSAHVSKVTKAVTK